MENLTRFERLTLVNQLLILEKLYPESSEFYALNRTALEKGFAYHYNDAFGSISDEGLSKDECIFVLDVLEMYRGITRSFYELESTTLNKENIKFKGFDGNNETKQMVYTRYFIIDLDRYKEIRDLAGDYFNSHSQMLPKYRAMLSEWKKIDIKIRYQMDETTILALLNTR